MAAAAHAAIWPVISLLIFQCVPFPGCLASHRIGHRFARAKNSKALSRFVVTMLALGMPGLTMADSDFPTVEGSYQITADWALVLPGRFHVRFEDDSLVLWRKGLTAWIIAWNNDRKETRHERWDWLRAHSAPGAFDSVSMMDGGILRYAYRLEEPRAEGVVHALYAYAIGGEGHVQMGIYFDHPADLECAKGIWKSLREGPPPAPPVAAEASATAAPAYCPRRSLRLRWPGAHPPVA